MVRGLGFVVEDLGLGVYGPEFRVKGLGFALDGHGTCG